MEEQPGAQNTASNLLYLPPPHQVFYRDEHLFVDLQDRVVTLDDETVALTRKEYRLLGLLAQHAGEAVPRPILLMRIRGRVHEMGGRRVDAHIHGLRRKLGIYANQYIETVVGVGYRFRPMVAP
jgi:DNA-binding response OmpR family regulator